MGEERIYNMRFKDLYPLYVQKAKRKGRTPLEVDELIMWLLGYSQSAFLSLLNSEIDVKTFFGQSPYLHPNANLIKGKICGVTIEDIGNPLMKKIRYLDKLIDELAKGKPMNKIKRTAI